MFPVRKHLRFWAFCVSCVTFTAALLTTDYLATTGVYAEVTQINGRPVDMRRVGVWLLSKCSDEHWIGKDIVFRDDAAIPGPPGPAGDIYIKPGRACWDRETRTWVGSGRLSWP